MAVVDTLYSGSAAIGEIKAKVTLVVGIIIVISLCLSGLYLVRSTPSRSEETKASVVDSECKQIVKQLDNKTSTSSECIIGVKYNVDTKEYINKVVTGGEIFKQGEKITIKYNPNNPSDISYNETSQRTIGFYFSAVAIIVLIFVGLYYYFIHKYKPLAALEGASTSINFAKNMFDRD
jgi:hypothetical protein